LVEFRYLSYIIILMSKSTTVQNYIYSLPPERQEIISKLRKVINDQLPNWYVECINYGMIGRVVPHSIYPDGYHCDASLALPFLNLASQKNYIALYHMGIYSDPELMYRFVWAYNELDLLKLDMGKSCIRFKKFDKIPYNLIWELVSKVSVEQRVTIYEESRK